MKKVYHLNTCKTCQRVISELGGLEDFTHQNIKEKNISAKELDSLAKKVGSYEDLFSRRSMKYRSMGLKDKKLSEKHYRNLILEEYTFLKRPVIVNGDDVFVGSAKATVSAARESIG